MQNEWIEIDFEDNEDNHWCRGILEQDEYEDYKYLMKHQDTIYHDLYENKLDRNDSISLY